MTAYLDHAREHAQKEFKDKVQREAVLETLDGMKKAQVEFIEVEEKAAKTLIELAENRSSKPADFQSVIAALRTDAAQTQGKLVQLRIRLKSQVTREQWAGLHPAVAPNKANPK
jgi:co-chaperonin GroES (HSP10)